MGLPDVRYPDGTEATPQIDLRIQLGLYAGVRPVRCLPGFPRVLADPRAADLDFVLVRESTEGLFATRGKGAGGERCGGGGKPCHHARDERASSSISASASRSSARRARTRRQGHVR